MTFRSRAHVLALLLILPLGASSGAPAGAQVGPDADAGPAQVRLVAIDTAVGPGAVAAAAAAGDASDDDAPDDPRAERIGWTVLIEHAGDLPWSRLDVVAELHGPLGSRSALRAALAGGPVPPVLRRVSVPAPSGPPGSDRYEPGSVVRITGDIPLAGSVLASTTSAVHPLRLRIVADGAVVGSIDTAIVRLGTVPSAPLAASLVWPLTTPAARGAADGARAIDGFILPGGRVDTLLTALDSDAATVVDSRDRTTSPGLVSPGLVLAPAVHLIEDLALRAADVPSSLVDEVLADARAQNPGGQELRSQDLLGAGVGGVDLDEGAVRAAVMLRRTRTTVSALRERPIVTPYADADLSRLIASGPDLRPLAARAALEGGRRIAGLFGRQPASAVLLTAPVAPAALDLLTSNTLLLPYAALEAPDLALDVPLEEPVGSLRSPAGRVFDVVVGDPYLSAALGTSTRTAPGDPVLAAHEVLVRTAMVHLEAPGREGRGLLLLPPDGFDPDPRFAAALLEGFRTAPWLTPSDPISMVAVARTAPRTLVLSGESAEPFPRRLVDAVRRTGRDLELLVGATAGVADEPAVRVGTRDVGAANDALLRAVTRPSSPAVGGTDGPTGPNGVGPVNGAAAGTEDALALLAGVRAGVSAAFGTFEVAAADVTLTDRDGIVPVTLTRVGGVPIRVRIEVTGPAALTWTDGRVRELVLPADGSGSVEMPVRSGPTGRFPVTVRVTDPTGERELATATLSVRATAVAGPALGLLAALVVVLGIVGTVRQRRRGPSVAAIRQDRDAEDGPRHGGRRG